jgi:hypothetical protein
MSANQQPPAAGDKDPQRPTPSEPRDKEQVDDEQLDSIAGGQIDPVQTPPKSS